MRPLSILLMTLPVLGACVAQDMPEAPDGARLFAQNCAACHGADARGAGPETFGIGKVPPDLTQISVRNGGEFPNAEILSIIDGYGKGTHPGRVMPEFGADLSGDLIPLEIGGVETPTPRALVGLLRYLQAIQE